MAFDFPNSPTLGQIATGPGIQWQWDGAKWVVMGGSTRAYNNVTISSIPPTSPAAGDMWWNTNDGNLYIFFNDGTSSQWVVANASNPYMPEAPTDGSSYLRRGSNQSWAAGLPLAGGTMSGPANLRGITDGSNAPAGMVGEYLSASTGSTGIAGGTWTSTATLTLTPGDWECEGEIYYSPNQANNSGMYAGITTTINASPPTYNFITGTTSFGALGIVAPRTRFNVTANTTIYLNGYIYIGSGTTCNTTTYLNARRMR